MAGDHPRSPYGDNNNKMHPWILWLLLKFVPNSKRLRSLKLPCLIILVFWVINLANAFCVHFVFERVHMVFGDICLEFRSTFLIIGRAFWHLGNGFSTYFGICGEHLVFWGKYLVLRVGIYLHGGEFRKWRHNLVFGCMCLVLRIVLRGCPYIT